jgi:hypothetical protein
MGPGRRAPTPRDVLTGINLPKDRLDDRLKGGRSLLHRLPTHISDTAYSVSPYCHRKMR